MTRASQNELPTTETLSQPPRPLQGRLSAARAGWTHKDLSDVSSKGVDPDLACALPAPTPVSSDSAVVSGIDARERTQTLMVADGLGESLTTRAA
jgi:hypothetical protein